MNNILVVKLADIGDVLTATPALRALRQGFPAARISVLVTPGSAEALRGLPYLDTIILFDKFAFDRPWDALRPRNLAAGWSFWRELRSAHYDMVFILHHLTTRWGALKYAALAVGSGAGRRIGLDNGRGWFLTQRVRDHGFGARHEVDYWLAVAEAAGARCSDHRMEIAVEPQDRVWAATALGLNDRGKHRGRFIAVHPGSGGHILARRWPPERYAAVGDALAEKSQGRIVIVGGPGEESLAQQMADAMRHRPLNLAGQTSLKQLAAVLARCCLFVGGDSGVMHTAVAVGTPVVALFGPTNEAAWGPYTPEGSGLKAAVVRAPGHPPCMYVGRRVGTEHAAQGVAAMQAITPQMVVEAAERLL